MGRVYNFTVDLPFGEELEYEVGTRLYPKHTMYKIDGYFKPFDLVCEYCGLTIECKSDRYDTGNMAFEVPLLRDSEADLLVYKVMGKTYWAKMSEVRYWIALGHELGLLKPQKMGENGNQGYIIPISDTIAYMEVLW